ncbi:MAG: 5'-methylthioadenosine/adenosylhomocysteine nucleosidase [Clostridia bacterium]|nr:5'-methylthioadenosine/adenosylhomocysteine nucleosidase [Clostridia bacterium]
MTGIIAAMRCEAERLAERMEDKKPPRLFCGVTFYEGRIGREEVVLAVCGVGKVFAASCTVAMIAAYHPDRIINTGVAGALSPDLHCLDTVVASRLLQHDMDTSAVGDPVGMISGIEKIYFETDGGLSRALAAAIRAAGGRAVSGTLATGDRFVAAPEDKERIRALFSADATDMEGGAVAQICYVSGVPFAAIRTISDGAEGDARMDYGAFCLRAADISAAAVAACLA